MAIATSSATTPQDWVFAFVVSGTVEPWASLITKWSAGSAQFSTAFRLIVSGRQPKAETGADLFFRGGDLFADGHLNQRG